MPKCKNSRAEMYFDVANHRCRKRVTVNGKVYPAYGKTKEETRAAINVP